MANTPVYSWPYPGTSDAPHGPNQLSALALAAEATVQALAASVASLLPASVSANVATNGNVTSTTFTTTRSAGGIVGVAFVAPPSGKVSVEWSAGLRNTGANATLAGVRIGTGATLGAGTLVLAASDDRALMSVGTLEQQFGRTLQHSGLTAGATYNAVIEYRATVITGVVGRMEIIVTPKFA